MEAKWRGSARQADDSGENVQLVQRNYCGGASMEEGEGEGEEEEEFNGERVLLRAEFEVENMVGAFRRSWLPCAYALPCLWFPLFYPCGERNIRDEARATDLLLTVVYRVGPRLSCCRCDCTRLGETERIYPLSRITDIEIWSTGGGCLESRFPLTTFSLQTSGGGLAAELSLTGVRDAKVFRDAVLRQKKVVEERERRGGGGRQSGSFRVNEEKKGTTLESWGSEEAEEKTRAKGQETLEEIKDLLGRVVVRLEQMQMSRD
ncbi:hypothetical protein QOT17_013894 [Balamuthia mandrillaris]